MKVHVILVIVIFSVIYFILPSTVSAHAGGGPPFLKINEKYAQTNPYFQGTMTVHIAQDNAPESYLVGKPVRFVVDVDTLLKQTTIPPGEKDTILFRWSFAQGDNFEIIDKKYLSGRSVTQTFSQPKSYLLILESKSSLDEDYIVIDTVQINVLPSATYHIPAISLFVGTEKTKALFFSQTAFDPSVKTKKYLWDFGEGQLHEQMSVTKDFTDLDTYAIGMVFNRVIDDHGFISDVGVNVYKAQDILKFSPFNGIKEMPVTFGTYDQAVVLAEKSNTRQHAVLPYIIGVLVVAGIGIFLVLKANNR